MFACWFDVFAERNKDQPMLLLFHRHMTHISIHEQRVLSDNIHLLEFPLHLLHGTKMKMGI